MTRHLFAAAEAAAILEGTRLHSDGTLDRPTPTAGRLLKLHLIAAEEEDRAAAHPVEEEEMMAKRTKIRSIGEESGPTMVLWRTEDGEYILMTWGDEYTSDAGRRHETVVTEAEGHRAIEEALETWYMDPATGDLLPGSWETNGDGD